MFMRNVKLSGEMDSRVFEAAHLGNIEAIRNLMQENPDVLDQSTSSNLNSILHVAARAGQADFASEILTMKPQMLTYVNNKLDTALHEAAREGHAPVVKVLLGRDEHISYKVNKDQETALFVACKEGHINIVQQLLEIHSLLAIDNEKADERTSLHAAADRGHAGIVKELLKVKPGLARRADRQGTIPLHSAVSHGHLEVTREILSVDPDLCYVLDGSGRSALHIAAMKGQISVLNEILSLRLESADVLTTAGETILHSAVGTNQFEVLKQVIDFLDTSELINKEDNDGNTVLHLATKKKLQTMVQWLVSSTSVNVNAMNRQGLTALDILESERSHSGALKIEAALKEMEAKHGYDFPPLYSKSEELKRSMSSINHHVQAQLFQTAETGDRVNGMARELRELHKEGIQNAANTVTVVAVLIATVAFTAIFTVPGGLERGGTAVMADTLAFKVFLLSDTVALFSSLMIVLILVTVVPIRRKVLVKLVFFSNKIMWVAVGCTASAFLAAGYVVVAPKSKWVAVSMCVVGSGSLAFVFTCLICLVGNHQMKKADLRRSKKRRHGNDKSRSRDSAAAVAEGGDEVERSRPRKRSSADSRKPASSDSDVESSERGGFHAV